MPGAFVPPPGLVEGTGPYAFMPVSERQALYNQLYGEWLHTPVNGAYPSTEGLVPTALGTSSKPFEGLLSEADIALLDVYQPGWRSTPAYYQTSTQAAALVAQAKQEQSRSGILSPGHAQDAKTRYDLPGGYTVYFDGHDYFLKQPLGDTVNGVPVSGGDALSLTPIQADQLFAAFGMQKRDGVWIGAHRPSMLRTPTPEQIAAILSPAAAPAPVVPTESTLTGPIAPHIMTALANPPTKPGEFTPADLASQAAKDTVSEIVAEMAKKQRAEEETTVMAAPALPGYTPIKLRPRT